MPDSNPLVSLFQNATIPEAEAGVSQPASPPPSETEPSSAPSSSSNPLVALFGSYNQIANRKAENSLQNSSPKEDKNPLVDLFKNYNQLRKTEAPSPEPATTSESSLPSVPANPLLAIFAGKKQKQEKISSLSETAPPEQAQSWIDVFRGKSIGEPGEGFFHKAWDAANLPIIDFKQIDPEGHLFGAVGQAIAGKTGREIASGLEKSAANTLSGFTSPLQLAFLLSTFGTGALWERGAIATLKEAGLSAEELANVIKGGDVAEEAIKAGKPIREALHSAGVDTQAWEKGAQALARSGLISTPDDASVAGALKSKQGGITGLGAWMLRQAGVSAPKAHVVAKGIQTLVDAGFEGQLAMALTQQAPAYLDALKNGDYERAAELAGDILAGTAFAHIGAEALKRDVGETYNKYAEKFGFKQRPSYIRNKLNNEILAQQQHDISMHHRDAVRFRDEGEKQFKKLTPQERFAVLFHTDLDGDRDKIVRLLNTLADSAERPDLKLPERPDAPPLSEEEQRTLARWKELAEKRTFKNSRNYTDKERENVLQALRLAADPTPEMLAFKKYTQGFSQETGGMAQAAQVITELVDHYITRLWGEDLNKPLEPNEPANVVRHQAANGEFHTSVSMARHRVLDTVGDGIHLGLKLAVTDPLDLAAYERAKVGEAIANRNALDRLREISASDGLPLGVMGGTATQVTDAAGNPAVLAWPQAVKSRIIGAEHLQRLQREGQLERFLKQRKIIPLGGEPALSGEVMFQEGAERGSPEIQNLADEYNKTVGLPPITRNRPVPEIDQQRAMEIADTYERAQHNPNDPEVQRAYAQFKKEIEQQWNWAIEHGFKFEPWTKPGQPYANSAEMMQDVINNHHLYFFTGGELPAGYPLSEIDPRTGVSYNNMFRAVHDLFGHAMHGFQFGPRGEEGAFQSHREMFSPLAQAAMFTETKAQNSWVNFGRHLRDENGRVIEKGQPGYVPLSQRPYAENKATILPIELREPGEVLQEMRNTRIPLPDLVEQILAVHNETGGSTFNVITGENQVGRDVWAYSPYKDREVILDHDPTPEELLTYIRNNWDLLRIPKNNLGTWKSPSGEHYLDVSTVVPDKEEALRNALKAKQLAITNLRTFEEVPTGYQPGMEKTLFQESAAAPAREQWYYSALTRAAEEKLPNTASADQILNTLKNTPGVKADELAQTGLADFLTKEGKNKISKKEVLDYLRSHSVELHEISFGELQEPISWSMDENGALHWNDYTIHPLNNKWLLTNPEGEETLFQTRQDAEDFVRAIQRFNKPFYPKYTLQGIPLTHYREFVATVPKTARGEYYSPHWRNILNPVFHLRVSDGITENGKRVLIGQEFQSDIHEKGSQKGYATKEEKTNARKEIKELKREAIIKLSNFVREHPELYEKEPPALSIMTPEEVGFLIYRTPEMARVAAENFLGASVSEPIRRAVRSLLLKAAGPEWVDKAEQLTRKIESAPPLPFAKNWHEVAFRRFLALAADEGYDGVVWTTGEEQTQRYNLAKYIENIKALRNEDGSIHITATDKAGEKLRLPNGGFFSPEALPAVIGKDLSQKIINKLGDSTGKEETFSGLDLKMGGTWAKRLYDEMIPQFAEKYAKKWGAKVTTTHLSPTGEPTGAGEEGPEVHALMFTPEMRKALVEQGQPLFQEGNKTVRKPYGVPINEWRQLRPSTREAVVNFIENLPSKAEHKAAAKAGAVGKYWYDTYAPAFKEIIGEKDLPKFTDVLAALSPRVPVRKDLVNALNLWADWIEAGRPTDEKTIEELARNEQYHLMEKAHISNVVRAFTGSEEIHGPKVNAFSANLMGDINRATLDTWMQIFAGQKPRGFTKAEYLAYESRVRETAKDLGWTVPQTQAAIWTFVKSLAEMAGLDTKKGKLAKPLTAVLETMRPEDLKVHSQELINILVDAFEPAPWEVASKTPGLPGLEVKAREAKKPTKEEKEIEEKKEEIRNALSRLGIDKSRVEAAKSAAERATPGRETGENNPIANRITRYIASRLQSNAESIAAHLALKYEGPEEFQLTPEEERPARPTKKTLYQKGGFVVAPQALKDIEAARTAGFKVEPFNPDEPPPQGRYRGLSISWLHPGLKERIIADPDKNQMHQTIAETLHPGLKGQKANEAMIADGWIRIHTQPNGASQAMYELNHLTPTAEKVIEADLLSRLGREVHPTSSGVIIETHNPRKSAFFTTEDLQNESFDLAKIIHKYGLMAQHEATTAATPAENPEDAYFKKLTAGKNAKAFLDKLSKVAPDNNSPKIALHMTEVLANALGTSVEDLLARKPVEFKYGLSEKNLEEAKRQGVPNPRGATYRRADGTWVVELAPHADASTVIHEWAHVLTSEYLSDPDFKPVLAAIVRESGESLRPGGVLTQNQLELLAKQIEAVHAQKLQVPEELKPLYQRIAVFLKNLYRTIVRRGLQAPKAYKETIDYYNKKLAALNNGVTGTQEIIDDLESQASSLAREFEAQKERLTPIQIHDINNVMTAKGYLQLARESSDPERVSRLINLAQEDIKAVERLLHRPETGQALYAAHGQIGESPEAISRVASERQRGVQRIRIDTRSGRETPIPNTVDAVDVKPGPYDRIVLRYPDGRQETVDQGPLARRSPAQFQAAKTPDIRPAYVEKANQSSGSRKALEAASHQVIVRPNGAPIYDRSGQVGTDDSAWTNYQAYYEHNKKWAKPGPYVTKLTPEEEARFQKWVKDNHIPWKDVPYADYDMRGYWKAMESGDKSAHQSANRHFPDTWKTPYDATFSRESKYALPNAPFWDGDNLIEVREPGQPLFQEGIESKEPSIEELQSRIEALQKQLAELKGEPLSSKTTAPPRRTEEEGSYTYDPNKKYIWNPDYYVKIDHPALKGWNWIAKTPEGVPIFMKSDLLIHPEATEFVRRLVGADKSPIQGTPILKAALKGSTLAKHTLLSLSPFHINQLALRALMSGVLPRVVDWNLHDDPLLSRLVRQGLTVGTRFSPREYQEGLISYGGLVGKIPAIRNVQRWLQEFTFEKLMPSLKVLVGKKLYQDYLSQFNNPVAVRKFIDQHREFAGLSVQDMAARAAAIETNERLGGLNYKQLGRTAGAQDFLRLMTLAPDWLETEVRMIKRVFDPTGGKILRRDLIKFTAGLWITARILNMLTTGKMHNEAPFGVVHKKKDGQEIVYSLRTLPTDMLHAVRDPAAFLKGRESPLVRSGIEAATQEDYRGRKETGWQTVLDLTRNLAPIPIQAVGRALSGELPSAVGNVGQVARSVGITAEPNLTEAEKKAIQFASDMSSKGPVDQAALRKFQLRHAWEDRLRSGEITPEKWYEQVAGVLPPKEIKQILHDYEQTRGMDADVARLYMQSSRLPMRQFMEIWDLATSDEKVALTPLMLKKKNEYFKKAFTDMTPAERANDPIFNRLKRLFAVHPTT